MLIELLTSGALGSALGAAVGIAERAISSRIELRAKQAEYAHIETMHGLQSEQDRFMAEQNLLVEQTRAEATMLTGSYEHDASFENVAPWVNNIRALVRPLALVLTFGLVAWRPEVEVFAVTLSVIVTWWFASRARPYQ